MRPPLAPELEPPNSGTLSKVRQLGSAHRSPGCGCPGINLLVDEHGLNVLDTGWQFPVYLMYSHLTID